jgi:hypothetical protein
VAELVKALLLDSQSTANPDTAERYYASLRGEAHKLTDQECPQLGDPQAAVALVEFSDYQCPHCAAAQQPLRDLVHALPKVRLCSKYFPLAGHSRAIVAAGAAEFARQKGRFWQMNDLLFTHQDALGDSDLKGFARDLGLEATRCSSRSTRPVRRGDRATEEGGAACGDADPVLQRPPASCPSSTTIPLLRPGRGRWQQPGRVGRTDPMRAGGDPPVPGQFRCHP